MIRDTRRDDKKYNKRNKNMEGRITKELMIDGKMIKEKRNGNRQRNSQIIDD